MIILIWITCIPIECTCSLQALFYLPFILHWKDWDQLICQCSSSRLGRLWLPRTQLQIHACSRVLIRLSLTWNCCLNIFDVLLIYMYLCCNNCVIRIQYMYLIFLLEWWVSWQHVSHRLHVRISLTVRIKFQLAFCFVVFLLHDSTKNLNSGVHWQ